MIKFQTEDNILVDSAPLEQMISLQHIADLHGIIQAAVRDTFTPVIYGAFFRRQQTGYDGQKCGFADGGIVETFDDRWVIHVKIFKNMTTSSQFNMDRISDRLRYALFEKEISYRRAAREMGVSRDVLFDYTNPDYPESAMQTQTLIKFSEYLGKGRHYFCNEYHKFIDTAKVGDLLRELRTKYGMTQKQFAHFLGITLASYKKYEEERCRLPLKVFEKLKDEIRET